MCTQCRTTESIVGCCKHVLDGVCSDACPTVKEVKSLDLCDQCAKLEDQHRVTVVREETSKYKRRLAHNKKKVVLVELKVVENVNRGLGAKTCPTLRAGKKQKVREQSMLSESRSSRRCGKVVRKRHSMSIERRKHGTASATSCRKQMHE